MASSPPYSSRIKAKSRHQIVSPEINASPQKLSSPNNGAMLSSMEYSTSPNTNADVRSLREALEEAQQRDATAKAALAKSDSVILELRSNIRQLKRQLEKLEKEHKSDEQTIQHYQAELRTLQNSATQKLQKEQEQHEQQLQELKSQVVVANSAARESIVGELQVQLDRAHAQILTADMVRKELEDTLEAEQYTWELRVQDQERTIQSMQSECHTLKEDLEQCRSQWNEAEQGWTKQVKELQRQLEDSNNKSPSIATSNRSLPDYQGRIEALEQERDELQGCLDEAMKELEAVDMELRQEPNSAVGPLQHLLRWVMERQNQDVDHSQIPDTTDELVEAIQSQIESDISANEIMSHPDAAVKVAELEAQLSVYRGDLKARDESTAELRASLKEAVALLKPLQDAVAKSEGEKMVLQDQLDELVQTRSPNDMGRQLQEREEQVKELQVEVETLQRQLTQLREQSPPSSPSQQSRALQSTNEEDHEKLNRKRGSEKALQEMLRNAQGRFQQLHRENHDVVAENEQLREKINELEREVESSNKSRSMDGDMSKRDLTGEMREAAILELEEEIEAYAAELHRKDAEVRKVREELKRTREAAPNLVHDYEDMKAELEELREKAEKMDDLEADLAVTKGDLEAMKDAEEVLTKSLKEALGLLKPLQSHLEIAEREKNELEKQLKASNKKLDQFEQEQSRSRALTVPDSDTEKLKNAISHLEEENDKLHHALEEVSQNLSMTGEENNRTQSRLQESLVEVKSRYEVTQDKLEGALAENHALIDALKRKEHSEKELSEEVESLRERIRKSEQELENAKYIATSALMKVEEMTMENVEKMSVSRDNGRKIDLAKEFGAVEEETPVVRLLKDRLETLERELNSSRDLNESLEAGIQERDRILESMNSKAKEMNGNTPSRSRHLV
jgi:chromosome segregation ATPase